MRAFQREIAPLSGGTNAVIKALSMCGATSANESVSERDRTVLQWHKHGVAKLAGGARSVDFRNVRRVGLGLVANHDLVPLEAATEERLLPGPNASAREHRVSVAGKRRVPSIRLEHVDDTKFTRAKACNRVARLQSLCLSRCMG